MQKNCVFRLKADKQDKKKDDKQEDKSLQAMLCFKLWLPLSAQNNVTLFGVPQPVIWLTGQWNFAPWNSSVCWHEAECNLARVIAMWYSEHKQALLASFTAKCLTQEGQDFPTLIRVGGGGGCWGMPGVGGGLCFKEGGKKIQEGEVNAPRVEPDVRCQRNSFVHGYNENDRYKTEQWQILLYLLAAVFISHFPRRYQWFIAGIKIW